MNKPGWLKPAVFGAAAGAVALAIVGFSWGGWVTGGTADKMASDQARLAVVAALVPICVEQSRLDPMATQTLAQMVDLSTYKRKDMVMATGWATMPGSSDPDSNVAKACVDELALQF